jgi:hypothetical protein
MDTPVIENKKIRVTNNSTSHIIGPPEALSKKSSILNFIKNNYFFGVFLYLIQLDDQKNKTEEKQ